MKESIIKTILLIPAYNPDESLPGLIEELKEEGSWHFIIVNDGSDESCKPVFECVKKSGCFVITHKKHCGKGAALKTGIRKAVEMFGEESLLITADSDGQHTSRDIKKVADALNAHPNSLVLGVRDFDQVNVPWKSRFGNKITSMYFKLTTGISCPDTQTGLRGIPYSLLGLALSEDGDRYEYEMNFLSDAASTVPFIYVPIETVYKENNKASHFNIIKDSALVYGRFLRFTSASLVSALVDLMLFYIFSRIHAFPIAAKIMIATVTARILSGGFNFLLNKYWSFKSRVWASSEAFRYVVLFVSQMLLSGIMVTILSHLLIPELLAKIIVDLTLFFIGFLIQRKWVFRKNIGASSHPNAHEFNLG